MSKFIKAKLKEADAEVARLDALISDLREERKRALYLRRALLGKPLHGRRVQKRSSNGAKRDSAPPPAKDREQVRLRVGSTAAREEERRRVRDGERVPVDRVET